jgi:hypothetical protein
MSFQSYFDANIECARKAHMKLGLEEMKIDITLSDSNSMNIVNVHMLSNSIQSWCGYLLVGNLYPRGIPYLHFIVDAGFYAEMFINGPKCLSAILSASLKTDTNVVEIKKFCLMKTMKPCSIILCAELHHLRSIQCVYIMQQKVK